MAGNSKNVLRPIKVVSGATISALGQIALNPGAGLLLNPNWLDIGWLDNIVIYVNVTTNNSLSAVIDVQSSPDFGITCPPINIQALNINVSTTVLRSLNATSLADNYITFAVGAYSSGTGIVDIWIAGKAI